MLNNALKNFKSNTALFVHEFAQKRAFRNTIQVKTQGI